MNLRTLLRASLVLFLLFPFLFLFTQFQISELPEWPELRWAFKNSFIQAFFSAFFAVMMGLWVSLGLVSVQGRWRRFLEILCLIPNFLPPLFTLLIVLNVIEFFPMGLLGIIFVHAVMNFGLVAVLLSHILESKLGPMAELAYIEGASKWQFMTRVLIPLLKKDLFYLGLFVFVMCFGSFSVPLVVGGGMGTTVEVLIYEKIRLSSEWGQAIVLAFLQSLFIFVLSFIVSRGQGVVQTRWANLKVIAMPTGLALLGVFSVIYLLGYLQGVGEGIRAFDRFHGMGPDILSAFLGSLFLGTLTGALCYGALLLISYCWPKWWFEKFLSGYVAPSTSLACFCLLIISPNEGYYSYLKIPVALVLLSLNGLFRMGWDSILQSLESQITVAYAMGASRHQIFKEILFPQISERAGILAGVAAIWACGDFAVSRILAHRDLSIAMMTESLMTGYRLNQALLLSVLIIVTGVICFFICIGGSHVLRRKLAP